MRGASAGEGGAGQSSLVGVRQRPGDERGGEREGLGNSNQKIPVHPLLSLVILHFGLVIQNKKEKSR